MIRVAKYFVGWAEPDSRHCRFPSGLCRESAGAGARRVTDRQNELFRIYRQHLTGRQQNERMTRHFWFVVVESASLRFRISLRLSFSGSRDSLLLFIRPQDTMVVRNSGFQRRETLVLIEETRTRRRFILKLTDFPHKSGPYCSIRKILRSFLNFTGIH